MSILAGAFYFALVGATQPPFLESSQVSSNGPCQEIASAISPKSAVYCVGSPGYLEDISHWASSSTQPAACSFEPGTPEDVGVALQILGRTQTPFAVKGGGHATNPGSSSTTGVQIAMSRFSDIAYDPSAKTVTIGAGLIWDDVYAALEPHGESVAGGRVPGVGVAGFTLGGGYSWLTNQYGLTVDTVQTFELVTPNGTVINVTDSCGPELFFSLRGGMNNFGIVTRFTLKTFPQTEVWGGLIIYSAGALGQVNRATANFAADNMDPKAMILTVYNSLFGVPGVILMILYDAPTPPPGTFDEVLAIPSFTQNVSTRSFTSFLQSIPAGVTAGTRAVFNSMSVTGFPLPLIESIVNESIYWGKALLPESAFFITCEVQPFLPTLFSHSTTLSAYPPDRAQARFPLNMYYAWQSPESDHVVYDAIQKSLQTLRARAVQLGIAAPGVYPNYAMPDTPLEDLYGEHLPRLRAVREAVDPHNVMRLAGGFKI